ncbi:hypothetical protein MCP1_420001 [Candidatus Terasakiella magnetica]|nr:hypothetical protein MCP1_420001 [Candidatus Terasakiella magnetica]
MGQDSSYNPFVSWVVDTEASRGFISLPDPRMGDQPFSSRLTDSRADGLRMVARSYDRAMDGVNKVFALVGSANSLRVRIKNDTEVFP